MAFELEKESVKMYEPLNTVKVKTVVDSDVIVPDTKPDVLNIVEISAVPVITEKKVHKDKISVSGAIDYTIIYSGGEEDIVVKSINHKTQFSEEIPVEQIDDTASCYVLCNVSHIESEIENSRKINIKSVISLEPFAARTNWTTAITKVNTESKLPFKVMPIDVLSMTVCNETDFFVSDEVRFPDALPTPDELLRVNVNLSSQETKPMNNKLIFKGNIKSDVMYISEGEIYHCESESPFTEVIDCDGLTPDMHLEIIPHLGNVEYELSQADTGPYIALTSKVCIITKGYEESTYDIILDAYSPDYEVEISKDECRVSKVEDSFRESFAVSEIISLNDSFPDILKICSLEVYPEIESLTAFDGYAMEEGTLCAKILYMSDSNTTPLCSVIRKIPFSQRINNKMFHPNSTVDLRTEKEHSSYVLKSERNIEVRASLKTSGKILSEKEVDIISDIKLLDDAPIVKDSQPGIVIYFADEGETTWDIAKKYNTLAEEIDNVNNLENNIFLSSGQQIIIPKRRVI